jgi:hypothetical protein
MTGELVSVSIPDISHSPVEDIEAFYALVDRLPPAWQYVFDMQRISFISPYGVIALITAARRLAALAGRPVRLTKLENQVHLYLKRINLFTTWEAWIQPADDLDDAWARNPQTRNLLELTQVTGPAEIASVVARAEAIFAYWLRPPNLPSFLRVLSELYTNVYEHSGDSQGCVLIQKYEPSYTTLGRVCLAVGDLGCGIRSSLRRQHNLGSDPQAYLAAAVGGQSGRASGRGGLGLRRIQQIVATYGGYLWLRSETAAVRSHSSGDLQFSSDLVSVPGTQVVVELHIPNGA